MGTTNKRSTGKATSKRVEAIEKRPKVLGAMKASQAAERIAAMGDKKTALAIKRAIKSQGKDPKFAALRWPWSDKEPPPYKYTEHAFGYFPRPNAGDPSLMEIKDAGNILPDASLKNANIKITLDRLRVFDYPGDGIHIILFDFYAQHQTSNAGSQDLHFTQNYRAQEGSGAGITGYPVFVGLKVGTEGVSFKCYTVNVKNEDDQKILKFLGSDVFKKGLELISTLNPVIPIVSGFATGIIDAFAHRNDNAPVQDFMMGLDFSGLPARAQLREGEYVAVQVPSASKWDWSQWVFNRSNGQIVSKANPTEGIPLNYVVFGVSKMQ